MSTYKTQGIIIKRSHFGEANLLLDVYTKEYGKIQVVARSARKAKGKLKGHLEIFLMTDIILAHGKNIDTVINSTVEENFLNFRKNLKISLGAYYALELINKMTIQHHKDERVFEVLKKELYFLDYVASEASTGECKVSEVVKKYYLSLLFLQINMLSLSGFHPEVKKCISCSDKIISGKNCFSFKLGGILDKKCSHKDKDAINVNDNAIKLIRLFSSREVDNNQYKIYLEKSFEKLSKIQIEDKLIFETIGIMNKFIEFNIDRKIEGIQFIK
ncbi:MAG: DNA repair protein RecO [Candidatus Pacebacteria bacterium]|nr:DNA repair protein RecO [Candidatus Paceibacterota bacterium]